MKIRVDRVEEIETVLEDVQSRAKARTIDETYPQYYADILQKKLDGLMLKKDQVGVVFYVDHHANNFPASYKGTPESTHFILEKFASGWFVTEVKRGITNRETSKITPSFSEAHEKAMIDFLSQSRNWS